MKTSDVLANEFVVRYDAKSGQLVIHTIKDGATSEFPVTLQLATLIEMGPDKASKWFGETIMLLVPEIRKKVFGLNE